jgi:hypothetical protein
MERISVSLGQQEARTQLHINAREIGRLERKIKKKAFTPERGRIDLDKLTLQRLKGINQEIEERLNGFCLIDGQAQP